jgi:hypothetical protein
VSVKMIRKPELELSGLAHRFPNVGEVGDAAVPSKQGTELGVSATAEHHGSPLEGKDQLEGSPLDGKVVIDGTKNRHRGSG